MEPKDLQPIASWCLESALVEVVPSIERFVEDNRQGLRKIKDHQWHALLREAVGASSVQYIQQYLHEQGTRSTREEWRQPVQLTFAGRETREPLWLALIKLLNWIRQESSPPQQQVAALERALKAICHDAKIGVIIALEPGTVELTLARVAIDRLIAKVEEVKVT